MYTQTHVHTYTHTHTHTDTCTHTHTCTCTQTHVQIHACTYTQTPPPPIKSCSTLLFTHRSRYCTLGEAESTAHTPSFAFTASAIEQSDGSQCQ
ncbi:unnamed protein product [Staurois parvus]|uniref:Uncharacterized protein n=1 Tax=Staurois parvus TaxID=386267 RepID=A0ABN9BVM4_9NEOB|nr:unnamed protein product [Staurois parvus]